MVSKSESSPTPRVRLGVSACLLGRRTRYDGTGRRDPYLTATLGRYVEWVPVCPEVECGLPVPREPLRLVGTPESPRMVTARTRTDHTRRMLAWARRRIHELRAEDLCGFVLKDRSPSCGRRGVPVLRDGGGRSKRGVGLFARLVMERFPLMPVEEAERLSDPGMRENFLERIFVLKRYRAFLETGATRGCLARFHADHKMVLLAHSPAVCRRMGRLVAEARAFRLGELRARYEALLLEALRHKATPRKHANVLRHMMRSLGKRLSPDEKAELAEAIERHRRGALPLVAPVTLLNHYVRKYGQPCLARQVYLSPDPAEHVLCFHA